MRNLLYVTACAAVIAALCAPSNAAEKIEYEGSLSLGLRGTAYWTSRCDKDGSDKCGHCKASTQVIVPDEWTRVELECVAYNENGMALGITLYTTDPNRIVTDTTGRGPAKPDLRHGRYRTSGRP